MMFKTKMRFLDSKRRSKSLQISKLKVLADLKM